MERIWIAFADNGNIRKWQSTPFDGAAEYRLSAALEATASPVATDAMVKALDRAADTFEEIRLILIKQLEEPARSAFWKAVSGRTEARNAALSAALPLTAPPARGQVEEPKFGTILSQIALWAEDEGLDLSMGQGDDLVRRIRSALTSPAEPAPATGEAA